ncbi:MAG: OmpA family protein, partial [Planctomycetota bacterium]
MASTRRLETAVQSLDISSARFEEDLSDAEASLAGYGENQIAVSNIVLQGGTVIARGTKVPPGHSVRFFGRDVPVDANGSFAAQEIVSAGPHVVDVTVEPREGRGLLFRRNLYVPDTQWFYVGLADLTVGSHSASENASLVTANEEFDKDVFVNGRAALYLKGKIKGEYLLTASLDTREGELEDIFSNLSKKDPRSLLRRLDPDRHYPVYGDDSTTRQDAPTQGKLYVRIEKGESYALWGNYSSGIQGTDLAQVDRGLYGARVHWVTEATTEHGEKKTQVDAFVASPDTIGAREEFRGTGGSLYYLRRIDVVVGSERIRVEVRDRDSGIVMHTRVLIAQEDYDIDYLQGRIILRRPLQSTADDGFTVDTGSLSGHPVFLVARYEFIPSSIDLDDFAAGGRATHWINDHIRFGATGSSQESLDGDQDLAAADMILRLTPETFFRAEFATSEGPGFGESRSLTGGFSFEGIEQNRVRLRSSQAYRFEAASNFKDFVDWGGRLNAYFEEREEGFSAPGKIARSDTRPISMGRPRNILRLDASMTSASADVILI